MPRIALLDESGLPARLRERFVEAQRKGAPDRNLYRVLARRPEILEGFAQLWNAVFEGGVLDHRLKELVRVKVASMYNCGY